MSAESKVYLVLRKGDAFVELSLWLSHHAKTGAEVTVLTRRPGTWTLGESAKQGREARTVGSSHEEAEALLRAEAQKLVKRGYVAEVTPFPRLDEAQQDLVLAFGGNLAAPPVGSDRRAPIFQVGRGGDTAISEAEDRALHRFARAVGLTARDPHGNTVLHAAARCSSVSLAEACLAAGVDPDAPGSRGSTPRQIASGQDPGNPARARLLELFARSRAAPRPTTRELCQAAGRGDLAEVRRCLAAGVSASAHDPDDEPPLFWAARSRVSESDAVLAELLAAGATPDDDVLEEALGSELAASVAIPRVERLVAAGVRPGDEWLLYFLSCTRYAAATRRALREALHPEVEIPLATAVTMRDLEAVRRALARGEDPDQEINSFPLLHLAACDGGFGEPFVVTMPASAAIVEALLEAGASQDVPRTPYRAGDEDHLLDGFPPFGRRADEAPRRALARGVEPSRRGELERIVAALAAARPAKIAPAVQAPVRPRAHEAQEGARTMDARTVAEKGITGKRFHLRPTKELRLDSAPFPFSALLAEPAFAEIEELDLAEHSLPPEAIAALLAWPRLAQLRVLDLTWNHVGWDLVDRLFASQALAGLSALRLSSSFGVGAEQEARARTSIATIAAGTALVGLEELVLGGMRAKVKGAEAFGAIEGYPKLSRLAYRGDEAKGKQVEGLAANPILAQLEELDVSCSGVTAKQLGLLFKSGNTGRLRSLDVRISALKSAGWALFATHASSLPALERLSLESTSGDEAALVKLSQAKLPALRELNLSGNESCATEASLEALARAPFLPQLRTLDLLATRPSAAALHAFVAAARLDALETLRIGHDRIGDEGVAILRSHPRLASARIEGVKVGLPGLVEL